MENGRLGALIAIVCGFLVGYKWPKLRKQVMPMYNKGKKQALKFARKSIKKTADMFIGRQGISGKKAALARS